MLYLEDYIEIIETFFPDELTERFTNMRELDLQVHNNKDKLDEELNEFFSKAHELKAEDRDARFFQLKQEYLKNLEHAQDKINISNQIYEAVEKYFRRLENDLHKFKLELEADNPGITEVIEKRALESENMAQRNKKKTPSHMQISNENFGNLGDENFANQLSLARQKQLQAALAAANNLSSTNMSYLSNEKLSNNPVLKAAASQAAINAMNVAQQNRRYSSSGLKSAYEGAANLSQLYNLGSFGFEPTDSLNNLVLKNSNAPNNGEKFYLKRPRMNKRNRNLSQYMDASSSNSNATSLEDGTEDDPVGSGETYCICNNISWGQMIFCEGKECPYQWFHYDCVGIKEAPPGDWFCPTCLDKMSRKNK